MTIHHANFESFASWARHSGGGRPKRLMLSLRNWLALCLSRYRERRALARLDDAALRDIGIDPHTARYEAVRPCWEGEQRLMDLTWRR